MPNIQEDLIVSPLSQLAQQGGKQVKIDIYNDGEGGWLLEAVDEHGNSTVWDDPFPTEQEALNEALRTIDAEGIDVLIGPPAASAQPPVDEFGELADFLASARNTAPSMDMPTLEGFLTAIVIGPQRVLPSQWLPWVWDQENGKDEPAFDGQEQANRILSLLMRKYNSLIDTDDSASAPFTPRFGQNARFGAQQWCEGFLFAAMFDEPAWSRLMAMRPTWFTPFLRLCAADGVDVITGAGDAPTWMNAIGGCK